MSKKQPKLLRGKFYPIYTTGGSHPSLLYKKNHKKNQYHVVVFDSSDGRHRTKLKQPIGDGVKESYVQNRPLLTTKKDFGNHELLGLRIHSEDKKRIEFVKRRNIRISKKYREYSERKRQK